MRNGRKEAKQEEGRKGKKEKEGLGEKVSPHTCSFKPGPEHTPGPFTKHYTELPKVLRQSLLYSQVWLHPIWCPSSLGLPGATTHQTLGYFRFPLVLATATTRHRAPIHHLLLGFLLPPSSLGSSSLPMTRQEVQGQKHWREGENERDGPVVGLTVRSANNAVKTTILAQWLHSPQGSLR